MNVFIMDEQAPHDSSAILEILSQTIEDVTRCDGKRTINIQITQRIKYTLIYFYIFIFIYISSTLKDTSIKPLVTISFRTRWWLYVIKTDGPVPRAYCWMCLDEQLEFDLCIEKTVWWLVIPPDFVTWNLEPGSSNVGLCFNPLGG